MSLNAEAIRNEKVKVVESMEVVQLSDVVMGQYRGRKEKNGTDLPGCEQLDQEGGGYGAAAEGPCRTWSMQLHSVWVH